MKIPAIAIVVFALITLAISFRLHSQPAKSSNAKPAAEIYLGLRNTALHFTREKIGLPPAATPTTPWAVVMDWGVANGTATVVASADGSASIYLSGGGGYIGGQPKPPINQAAKHAVLLAAACQPGTSLTSTFPLPATGQVTFYLLTDQGIFTVSASSEELRNGHQPLSQLGNAMQEVITQYRLLQPNN